MTRILTWTTALHSAHALLRPTARERAAGRYLRGPDGHDMGGDAAPAEDETVLGGDDAFPDNDIATPGSDTAPDDSGDHDDDGDYDAPVVPESYDLTPPDGMTIDAAALNLATPVFQELGLTNDQANMLVPVAAQWAQKVQDDHNTAILSHVQADRKAWLDTARADPEIGGRNWDATLATAAGALDRIGFEKGSPFRALLNDSGLGNHPEMIRAWARIGKAIGEDSDFIRATGATTTRRDAAETLYPDDRSKGA